MWRPQVDWILDLNRPRARARDLEAGRALPALYHQAKPPLRDSQPARIEHEHEDDYGRPSWRVIVPDLRGYGESTVDSGKTTLDVFAGITIAGLSDQLDYQWRGVIGGLSMGVRIVAEFCRQYPERVRGGVSCWRLRFAELKPRKANSSARRWRNGC